LANLNIAENQWYPVRLLTRISLDSKYAIYKHWIHEKARASANLAKSKIHKKPTKIYRIVSKDVSGQQGYEAKPTKT